MQRAMSVEKFGGARHASFIDIPIKEVDRDIMFICEEVSCRQ